MKSDFPTIVQVIAGNHGTSRIFELTLHNKLPRDVLIRRIEVSATDPGKPTLCYLRSVVVYEIANMLTVNGGGSGKLTGSGTYVETVRGSDMAFPMSATIERDTCNASVKMNFSLSVSFLIPKDSYSAIRVELPTSFKVTGSRFFTPVADKSAKPPITPDSGSLRQFSKFHFALSTGEENELDLEASYP